MKKASVPLGKASTRPDECQCIVVSFKKEKCDEELLSCVQSLFRKQGLTISFEHPPAQKKLATSSTSSSTHTSATNAKDASSAKAKADEAKESKEPQEEGVVLGYITSSFTVLMELADELQLTKRALDGKLRSFDITNLSAFIKDSSPDHAPFSFFASSEQLLLLYYATDKVHPSPDRFDDIRGRETLLMWLKRKEYVDAVFALHDEESIKKVLGCFSYTKQLLTDDDLLIFRDYFGDRVALYFGFLSYYANKLDMLGSVGFIVTILVMMMPQHTAIIMCSFAFFAVAWAVLFIAGWKRKNTKLTYTWRNHILGDSGDEDLSQRALKEELRPEFVGEVAKDPITGEDEYVYPTKYKVFKYTVSWIIIFACLFVTSQVMIMALDYTDINNNWINENALLHWWSKPFLVYGIVLGNVPLALYMTALTVFDMVYRYIAQTLNDWENHKYEYEHDNALVLKLVLFQFIAMNMSYLYMAFVLQDMGKLFVGLRNVLMIELVTGNVKESLIPFVMQRRTEKAKLKEMEEAKKKDIFIPPPHLAMEQSALGESESVFDDYFELTNQFAKVSVFATAFPFGSVLAAMNNHVEIYSDTFKRCRLLKRPLPHRALTIGSWLHAFDLISVLAVISNLMILSLTGKYMVQVLGDVNTATEFFVMVGIEHMMFIVRVFMRFLIPHVPTEIAQIRAKEKYEASKAK